MFNRLKELRLKNGFTLSKLSENIGIPVSTLSKYENQKRNLNGANAEKLCEYFKVSYDYLVGLDDLNDVTVMLNEDDSDLLPFEATTVHGRKTATSINKTIKLIDSENNLLYTDERKKDLYTHDKEIDLLKTMQKAFSSIDEDIELGLDRGIVKTESQYVEIIKKYTIAFKILDLIIGFDEDTQNAILKISEKLAQNKKASDD